MSKYIKFDDAIDCECPLNEIWEDCIDCPLNDSEIEPCKMGRWLKSLLTIDIVECKDCIHCADDWNGNQPQFTCELGLCAESVYPNDFCSCGVRSEK